MIINYPTGLYNIKNQDNITWHISSNIPPRGSSILIKVPVGELVSSSKSQFSKIERRGTLGKLVYTINEANNSSSFTNTKQYAEGDVLDFVSSNLSDLSIPDSKKIESVHNLNEIDFKSMGLSDDEIDAIKNSSFSKRDELDELFLTIRSNIEFLDGKISENQKSINEVDKAIDAVTVLGDEQLLSKLNDKRQSYLDDRDELQASYEEYVAELRDVVDNIVEINKVLS